MEGIKHFRTYTIFTDRKALKYLVDQKEAEGKLKLMDNDFKIIHKPGKMNEVVDALSKIFKLILSGRGGI